MHAFTTYFLYFIIYAFFGYICEVIYVALCTKKITNRGYLYGPLVPIYGYGAIVMILVLQWVYQFNDWYFYIIVFVLGFLITSTLEYLTSLGMELIFHMRWWDYSDKFMNINGRVCLRNSSMFGALIVIVMYLVHPYVVTKAVGLIESLGDVWFYIIAGLLFVGMTVDTILSTIKHINVSKIIRKLENMAIAAQFELQAIKDTAVEKASTIKGSATEKLSSAKDYLSDTRIVKSLAKINIHYPSMKIKSQSLKMRVSIDEFINKIKEKLSGE